MCLSRNYAFAGLRSLYYSYYYYYYYFYYYYYYYYYSCPGPQFLPPAPPATVLSSGARRSWPRPGRPCVPSGSGPAEPWAAPSCSEPWAAPSCSAPVP